jgi:hypothetical protein
MSMYLLLVLTGCTPSEKHSSSPKESDPLPDSHTTRDSDSDPLPVNEPPTAPEITITPAIPAPGIEFSVSIVSPSVDPEGAEVSYRYAWTVDGAAGPETATIPGDQALLGQIWTVRVTPNDGAVDGPFVESTVTVGNAPPSAPGLSISPEQPVEGDTLTLTIDPLPIDPEGDPITTTITWYQNDTYTSWFDNLTVIESKWVNNHDTFRVVVSVTDGLHDPIETELSITAEYTCDFLPPFNLGDTTLSDARAYHGIAFGDDGSLIGYDARSALVKSFYDGTRTTFLPGVSGIEQIDRLPDGDYVLANGGTGSLTRLTANGGTETIAEVGTIYGVTVGPDGMIYATYGNITRVDPATGEATVIYEAPRNQAWTAHAINFSLDSTRMYIGTIGGGVVYYMDLDADLNPTTTPQVFANGLGSWHDGVEVDTCGNVYVADYGTRSLYRIESNGTVTSMVTTNPTAYGHGVKWGSGLGGWMDDTLYQPQPYNGDTVREVRIGFASGDTVRTWNGMPAPW